MLPSCKLRLYDERLGNNLNGKRQLHSIGIPVIQNEYILISRIFNMNFTE